MTEPALDDLARAASTGRRDALEQLLGRIQQPIYGLAVRMLWHPEDARDATQEILIRIMTHLASFRGESRFMTWAYRVASNYLLTCRQGRVEAQRYTFDRFGDELREDLDVADASEWAPDKAVLLEEVKVGCMLAMLTCLDREHRLAYVLGEILELDGPEAAAALDITPAAFRKRLSRARSALVQFTRETCGLMRTQNPCHCTRKLSGAIQRGRVDGDRLLFADAERARMFPAVLHKIRALADVQRTAALYRSHSEPPVPAGLLKRISAILDR
jgi:RNA polymerase sigma factor (sigma-70 family)